MFDLYVCFCFSIQFRCQLIVQEVKGYSHLVTVRLNFNTIQHESHIV